MPREAGRGGHGGAAAPLRCRHTGGGPARGAGDGCRAAAPSFPLRGGVLAPGAERPAPLLTRGARRRWGRGRPRGSSARSPLAGLRRDLCRNGGRSLSAAAREEKGLKLLPVRRPLGAAVGGGARGEAGAMAAARRVCGSPCDPRRAAVRRGGCNKMCGRQVCLCLCLGVRGVGCPDAAPRGRWPLGAAMCPGWCSPAAGWGPERIVDAVLARRSTPVAECCTRIKTARKFRFCELYLRG